MKQYEKIISCTHNPRKEKWKEKDAQKIKKAPRTRIKKDKQRL